MKRSQFALCFGVGLLMAAGVARAQYALGPDSQPREGVAKGTVTKHVLPPGKVYAGVPHNYAVYVPAGYDAAKPVPYMVFLDGSGALGNGQRVPTVFDNLIAKGELPPLIGIFVDPGVLPAATSTQQSRFHRILEYDSIDGRFARFLEEELIAEVGKTYNLSKDPSDHAIAGVSTGAVGAFSAAWNRPDLFRRVLSFIGTYVAMRGAESFPAMIRRSEPKPLRVFLEAGKNDHILPEHPFGTFYAGSWPINNQLMFEAMQFAGYDVKLEYGENAHNMNHGSAIMPDALRWLWREYPKKIEAQTPQAMRAPGWEPRAQVFSVIHPGKPWEVVPGDYQSVAGIAASKTGKVYFSDPASDRILVWEGGKSTVFKAKSGGAQALRVGGGERLYAAQKAARRIVSWGDAGDEKVVAKGVAADDFVVMADGSIYFLDAAAKTIGLLTADGKRRQVYDGKGSLVSPAAMAVFPDQGLLLVADAGSRLNWSFQVLANGDLGSAEPFYRVDLAEGSARGSAGVTADSIGQAYFATALGVQLCEQNGRCAAILSKPGRGELSTLTFGGEGLNWLYLAEDKKLYRRPVQTHGPLTPTTPPKPPL